jgi:hypothetical protein
MIRSARIILSLLALAVPATAMAQKENTAKRGTLEKFVIEALPDVLARRVESQRQTLRQFGISDPDKTPKGVFNAFKVWTPNYPAIKVCFFSGSRQLRVRIAKIAMEWKGAVPGLPLDFADLANPRLCRSGDVNHIRISFNKVGYYSLVGTDSVHLQDQTKESMNLQEFDHSPPNDDEFRATVLHEFGHAIGLEHEHQNPLAKCRDEFDWPKIYKYLSGPPNNWSKETVDFNMGALHEAGLKTTDFDKKSIMLYTFPAFYFKNGEKSSCFNPTNTTLSGGDGSLVGKMYPVGKNARIEFVGSVRGHLLSRVKDSGKADGAKSGIFQLIDEYVPEQSGAAPPQR